MNYKDVALLNGSLDSLGDSLLKNKMMDQQSKERLAQTGLQSQRLQVDQGRWNAEQEHWQNMEKKADQANTLATSRGDLQEDQAMLKTVMGLNAGGQLTAESRKSVNNWLSDHPRFAVTGMQLAAPKAISPQAGQNSVAQALAKADQYDGMIDEMQKVHDAAPSDEEKAAAMAKIQTFQDNAKLLRKVAQRQAEPKLVAQPKVKVKTGGKSSSEPEVTQEMSPEQYAAYQQNRPKGKPTKAIASTYVQKYGQAGALDALKKDGYDPSGYAD